MQEEWIKESSNFRSKLADLPPAWNAITERIIGAAVEVQRHLGPGMPERHYEDVMSYELGLRGLRWTRQKSFRVRYKDIELSECRLDLLVEDLVVLELKAVERVSEVALAQLVSYLRVFQLPIGLLINFHTPRVTDGIYRRINTSAIAAAQSRLSEHVLPHIPHSASSGPSAPPRSV